MMKSCAIVLIAVASSAVLLAQSHAWTVASGDIRIVCPMTIGGSFEARTRSIAGSLRSPATTNDPYVGQLTVDLATLDTGIGPRYLGVGVKDEVLVRVTFDASPSTEAQP
jgi:hypothetical protein